MEDKEYYICSQDVIDMMQPIEVSLPITMYPGDSFWEEIVYVAVLDFPAVQAKYNELEENEVDHEFWVEEIVPGQMSVDTICMNLFQKKSPWEVILDELNLSKMNNRAMTICNLAEREGLDPISFWNQIANMKNHKNER